MVEIVSHKIVIIQRQKGDKTKWGHAEIPRVYMYTDIYNECTLIAILSVGD